MNQPATPPTKKPERFALLKRINASLGAWAATLTWWRMAALALITAIAANWIFETLALNHEREKPVKVKRVAKAQNERAGQEHPCEGEEIRIGGKNGLVFCEGRRVANKSATTPSTAPSTAPSALPSPSTSTSAPAIPAASDTAGDSVPPGPAPPAQVSSAEKTVSHSKEKKRITISVGGDDEETASNDEGETTTRGAIKKTISGWIGDIFSAVLIALFAYLVAAKIIVRKTAEADAKLRVATDSADHEAMQRQLVQARLKLLQAQVEPHFLFNTLAAVDYLIETDAKRASVMQKTLISYLRAALPQMRQESSTLGREITLIRAYLQLLKLRIEDRLEFDIKVAPNLESAVFPPMVLQTLVENAIKHGIEPKPEGGRITVQAEIVDGNLRVDVVDTGVGLPDGDIFGSSKNGTGLGLDNIRNRLAMLYPGASRMELRSGHEGGTLVRLSIPYQPQTHS